MSGYVVTVGDRRCARRFARFGVLPLLRVGVPLLAVAYGTTKSRCLVALDRLLGWVRLPSVHVLTFGDRRPVHQTARFGVLSALRVGVPLFAVAYGTAGSRCLVALDTLLDRLRFRCRDVETPSNSVSVVRLPGDEQLAEVGDGVSCRAEVGGQRPARRPARFGALLALRVDVPLLAVAYGHGRLALSGCAGHVA